ncbi:MAG: hypothetical protein WCO69_03120 [Candidatus Omnitrophota bacterium]
MISLRIFLCTAVLFFMVEIAGNAVLSTGDDVLVQYQLNKLNDEADIIFFGDSSLGNSLDAAYASALTGKRVLNFALTGRYGLVGSRIMIEKYLARHRPPQAIIVVLSADSFPRKINENEIKMLLNRDLILTQLISARRLFMAVQARFLSGGKSVIVNDYVKQGSKINPRKPGRVILHKISEVNSNSGTAIGELCAQKGIRCLMACGPILDVFALSASDYFKGLPVFKGLSPAVTATPFAIAPEDVGDSVDHVAPEKRRESTRRWAGFIEQELAR